MARSARAAVFARGTDSPRAQLGLVVALGVVKAQRLTGTRLEDVLLAAPNPTKVLLTHSACLTQDILEGIAGGASLADLSRFRHAQPSCAHAACWRGTYKALLAHVRVAVARLAPMKPTQSVLTNSNDDAWLGVAALTARRHSALLG